MKSETDIAAIVLAAGASSRMGGDDKLLMQIDGEPLLLRSVKQICASNVSSCIVVVRDHLKKYRLLLDETGAQIVHEPNAHEGMSTSLRAGVQAMDEKMIGCLICLADMPDLTPEHYNRVIASHKDGKIVRPKHETGKFGHPVLFDQFYFEALKDLAGDEGARAIVQKEQENVIELLMDSAVLTDLDTPEAWSDWRAKQP